MTKLKTLLKNYHIFFITLLMGVSLLSSGCKQSHAQYAHCAAPKSVSCGAWTPIDFNPPPLQANVPQVILETNNAIECANHSGLMTIPSTNDGITAHFTSQLFCNLSDAGVCTCTGNTYIPQIGTQAIAGQYELNLTCLDQEGFREIFVSTGTC